MREAGWRAAIEEAKAGVLRARPLPDWNRRWSPCEPRLGCTQSRETLTFTACWRATASHTISKGHAGCALTFAEGPAFVAGQSLGSVPSAAHICSLWSIGRGWLQPIQALLRGGSSLWRATAALLAVALLVCSFARSLRVHPGRPAVAGMVPMHGLGRRVSCLLAPPTRIARRMLLASAAMCRFGFPWASGRASRLNAWLQRGKIFP